MEKFETTLEKISGKMAARIRSFDWRNHPLGPLNDWPQSLKTVIQVMLRSKYAMWLGWGPEFHFFYNDAYLPTLGIKEARALGVPASQLWQEIWPTIGPRVEEVVRTGEATWEDALLLILERSGFPEETYHTFSYGPAPDDNGGVGGMLCVVTEETERIIGERRLAFLGKLATELTSAKTERDLFQALTRSVEAEDRDLPYAAVYLFDQARAQAELAWVHTVPCGTELAPLTIKLDTSDAFWSAASQIRAEPTNVVRSLGLQSQNCPRGPWDKPAREAVFTPIAQQGQTDAAGFLVVGVNPYRPFSDSYQRFLSLVAGQIASALSNARAYEAERKRAEALAEIDRAKTAFFNNVSHELRTPLTLMMGPLEDLLQTAPDAADSPQRELAAVAHRNGLRLLKLVNTLLDFARIEAGRMQATFAPADLSVCTSEIASCFHSIVEKAGLQFLVDCPPVSEPVFIDHELWEKIILNLLSNAFKFTLKGAIKITIREEKSSVIVQVKDTGCGIPHEAKPRLFERFYRVDGAQGRTHEGTGIGLALVNELVKLHGGILTFESELGKGTTFTVRLLKGCEHLPRERLSPGRSEFALSSSSFFSEAARWTDETFPPPGMSALDMETEIEEGDSATSRPTVLLVDDNADMRQYITRLLTQRFDVLTARDGQEALETLERGRPDLILSDVMMPRLDGLGLLKAVRAHPQFHSIPFIVLSARAGEEARVEGVASGADDYLVKPFSARELLARVKTHVQLSRLRKESTEKLRHSEERLLEAREKLDATLNAAAIGTWSWDIPKNLLSADENLFSLFSVEAGEDKSALLDWFLRSIHPEDLPRVQAALNRSITGESEKFEEDYRVLQKGRPSRWVASRGKVRRTAEGKPELMTGVLIDITDRKYAEEVLRRNDAQIAAMVDRSPVATYMLDARLQILHVNTKARPLFAERGALTGASLRDAIAGRWPQKEADELVSVCRSVLKSGESFSSSGFCLTGHGHARFYDWEIHRLMFPDGQSALVCYFADVTAHLEAQEKLREAAEQLDVALSAARLGHWSWDADKDELLLSRRAQEILLHDSPRQNGAPSRVKRWEVHQRLHAEDRVRAELALKNAVATKSDYDMEYRVQHGAKGFRWIAVKGRFLSEGNHSAKGMMGVVQDITERKRGDLHLRSQRDILEMIVRGVDLNTIMERLTDSVEEVVDRDIVATILLVDSDGKSLVPAAGRRSPANWTKYISHVPITAYAGSCGTAAFRKERVIVTDIANDPLWSAYAAEALANGLKACWSTPIISSTGQVLGTFAIYYPHPGSPTEHESELVDIVIRTAAIAIERKTSEQALKDSRSKLKQYAENLEQMVVQRTSQLQETIAELEAFSYSVSHDLRAPLRAMQGYTTALLKDYQPQLDKTAGLYLSRISKNAERLELLVRDILAYSKVAKGEVQLSPVSLRPFIENIIILSPHLQPPNAEITILGALPDVYAHEAYLSQVFSNLLGNAVKFRHPERSPKVVVSAEKQGEFVVVSVTDNGLGIDPDHFGRIFQIFGRVYPDKKYEGTGIGLAIVKKAVERMGGAVGIESNPGEGSTFWFRLTTV